MYVPLSSNVSATAPRLSIAEDDGRSKEFVEGGVRRALGRAIDRPNASNKWRRLKRWD
jgi:hypothetical protein